MVGDIIIGTDYSEEHRCGVIMTVCLRFEGYGYIVIMAVSVYTLKSLGVMWSFLDGVVMEWRCVYMCVRTAAIISLGCDTYIVESLEES